MVLPVVTVVRVRVIRMACSAWGKAIPPGVVTVTALTVRVSVRPWPRSRVWWPIGTCAHGRVLSWACRVGWLALTGMSRWAPQQGQSLAYFATTGSIASTTGAGHGPFTRLVVRVLACHRW